MKRCIPFLLAIVCFACNNSNNTSGTSDSENDIDAARNFIRASLDRNWNAARNYLLQDSANLERIASIEESTKSEKKEVKSGYKDASIQLYDTRKVSDSVSVVLYSNSYMNKKDSLKVVKVNDKWLVDLKYTFLPTPDSSTQK